MNKNQIARRYSRALINNIDISGVPQVIDELKAFSLLIEKNRKLKLLFAGLIFSDGEKEKALNAILPGIKFSAPAEKFLRLVILQGHLAAIKEIITASINDYNERQKKATAVVISSVPLSRDYTERLRGVLKAMTHKEIDIQSQVDTELLGGFIVKVGSTIYDSSVKGQLRMLRAELMK